jgi:hypothetical protein
MRPRGLVLASPKVNVWPLLFAHIVTVSSTQILPPIALPS